MTIDGAELDEQKKCLDRIEMFRLDSAGVLYYDSSTIAYYKVLLPYSLF